jgi:outer membrane protein assembly factor BamB
MKTNRMILFLVLALLAALLSACGGTPVATTWPGLAADAKTAYLTNGTLVYAVSLSDGTQNWVFPNSTDKKYKSLQFHSTPVFTSDGQLIIGSTGTNTTLFRLDPDTGKDTWSFSGAKNQWIASPLVVGEMVYAPNVDGILYIFDMSLPGDDKLAGTVELGGRLWAQPATDGEFIYVTSLDHKVFAVDPQKMTKAWDVELDGAIAGSALVADGKLYVGSFGTTLEAIDIATHKIVWTAPTEGWLWGVPVLDGGTLYFGDLNGNFYAINAADGKPAADSIKPDGAILASPIVVNGNLIFVTESGVVYSLEVGGKLVSLETIAGSKIYTAPVLAGDLILIAPFQGESLLVALDTDGKQVWAFTPQK